MDDLIAALEQLTQESDRCVLIYRLHGTWWIGTGDTDLAGFNTAFAWGDTLQEALANFQAGRVIGEDTVLTFVRPDDAGRRLRQEEAT